ncbi:ATP-binding protein [Parapedobacter tibetensis]|uniref:ATP-binding protein n=1 Tax=Parapedobacter tibetensis TaxID=2972951 RepID=UPI00214DCF8C|nr:ATP-binding protein [Parapedobacter tibetensis]
MYERPYLQDLTRRVNEPRRFIQVIMGPRQVGKTTLVTQLTAGYEYPFHFVTADAVPAAGAAWLEQQWETARLMMKQRGTPEFLLVIDEIQKIANWSETVKLLWDTDSREQRNIKVILLGSSRLLLQQGLTESLAGRFETSYLGHWSFAEMRDAFSWDVSTYVWFGGYPGAATLIDDEDRWKRYVHDSLIETSISRDILMLTRVDKPALMKRLFELGCIYSGKIMAYTKMLGQLVDAGNTTTLAHYLELLNTAGLLSGLEKHDPKLVRKRSSSPKFQVHNTALISAQRNEQFDEVRQQPDEWGHMVESAVGAHLINGANTDGYQVSYWRESGYEVDFVLERRGKVIGIEVKSGSIQTGTNMPAFRKAVAPDRVLLVGHSGIPWEEFLMINPLELF